MSNFPSDLVRAIRGVVFDVDGVLTDGRITYTDDGHELKSFHVQDGASIKLLMENEIAVGIITGRRSPIVAKRARELGISHVIQGATDNSIGLPYSLISCDIICNCDGTVYLSPSDLSCKLLTLEGVLNEMSDAQCSPFPVQAKYVKYCTDNVQNSRSVLCYTVTPNPSVEPTSTRLVACLVCRYKFDHTDQLFTHGTVIHNLTFDFQQNCSNSSAIIQQVRGQQPTLAFLTFDQRMSTELLISRNEETITASGSRRPSVSTPPTPASKLVSGLHGTNSVGCEDHPDGGIECPKCDLILSSTRSLGGKRYAMANIKW